MEHFSLFSERKGCLPETGKASKKGMLSKKKNLWDEA